MPKEAVGESRPLGKVDPTVAIPGERDGPTVWKKLTRLGRREPTRVAISVRPRRDSFGGATPGAEG